MLIKIVRRIEKAEFNYKGYNIKMERPVGRKKIDILITKDEKEINYFSTTQGFYAMENQITKDIDVLERTGGQI